MLRHRRSQLLTSRLCRVLARKAEAGPVRLTADLEDAGQLFRDSVLLVPLDCGGGTRLKVLQAFAAGCPVISTAKGMEGIAAGQAIHYLQLGAMYSAATQLLGFGVLDAGKTMGLAPYGRKDTHAVLPVGDFPAHTVDAASPC